MSITGTLHHATGVRCGDTAMGEGWVVNLPDLAYALVPHAGQADISEKYARLIAAAPDLLSACQEAFESCRPYIEDAVSPHPELQKQYDMLKAAIAKATESGEEVQGE